MNAAGVAAVLRVQADALEVQVRALRAQADALEGGIAPSSAPRYATKKSNPCGSVRAFTTACRSGAFDTFKLGRELAARWEDVAAFVEGRVFPARTTEKRAETDPDRAALEAAGIKLGPSNARPRTTRGGRHA